MPSAPPRLTYFCELEAKPLEELFSKPGLIEFLQVTQAGVSLGILDLSDQRAEVVRCLNKAGVSVTAWLLLPKDQGYWFNLDNAPQAKLHYRLFQEWTQAQGLKWARIGLDIEPDIRVMQTLTSNRWAQLQRALSNLFDIPRLRDGTRAYHALVKQIHTDGYVIESYQFPFIVDERFARSSLLQRIGGLVDLPEVDREVLMLYSSFTRPWGQGILWSYAAQAQGIGVGSTGGGVDQEAGLKIPPLNWAELQTDLLLAHRHSEWIYVFSLEGCVRENFLPLLRDFNWQQSVQIPYAVTQRVQNLRKPLQRILWVSARPAWLLFGMALVTSALTLLIRGRRK